jgi:hypothetical protein
MSKEKDKIEEVHQARQAAYSTFKEKWDQMADNSQFLRLNQYSDSQLTKMEKQKRVPYILDYINSAVNTYLGIQRDRRTEIFYYPVEEGDAVATEVLNAVKDATLNQNNFIYTESDVFADGLIEKLGAVSYEWSREKDKNGGLLIRKLRPRELMWDLNAQEYDKSDATWMSRYRMFDKENLKVRFPWMGKKFDKLSFFTGEEIQDMGLRAAYVESITDSENGWVALIEYFKRVYELRYFVRTSDGVVEPIYYKDKKSAEESIKETLARLQGKSAEMQAQGQPVEIPTFSVFTDKTAIYKKTTVCHDLLVTTEDGDLEETLDEPFYPIDVYHPYWHDGDWWCPVDIMKDAQRYFNKMFSQLDHWIGTMSKGLLLGSSKNPEEEKKVQDVFSTTGGFIHVEDAESYKLFESRGPAPQLFNMADLARQNLEDNSGGRNFSGKKETASESGVAVRQRIEQGGLAGFIIYDNLRRWKMSVGSKIAWYLTNYMSYSSVVRIEGEELVQATMEQMQKSEASRDWFKVNPMRPGVGFLKINTTEANTLENLKVDVNVDEARWSVSKATATLQDINAAMQSNPLLAKVFPPEAMVEYMPLSFSVKAKALARMKQLEEMQMQIEQAKAQKPPSLSADIGDIDKLPPEGQVQLAAMFGIQLDPNSVVDKDAQKTQMELQAKSMELQMKGQSQQMTLEGQAQKMELEAQAQQRKLMLDGMKQEQGLMFDRAKFAQSMKDNEDDGRLD